MPRRDERRERRQQPTVEYDDDDYYSPKKTGNKKTNNYDDGDDYYSGRKTGNKNNNDNDNYDQRKTAKQPQPARVEKAPSNLDTTANNANRVHVHQPIEGVWEFENHWQKDFIDCCEDCGICACAFFCTPCFMGKLFKRTDECVFGFCLPGGLMSFRTKLRTAFRIKGSIFKDCMATTCCPICAAIQLTQELNKQEL